MRARQIASGLLAAGLLLTGCAQGPASTPADKGPAAGEVTSGSAETVDASRILVVNYSWPVTGMGDEDTNTSASVVLENGDLEGNTDYAARIIADQIGADRVRLETVDAYPTDYEALTSQAREEQEAGTRPALKEMPDLADYDTVILVSPNWWADLPMPVYTFLEGEDWQGKQIIPVIIHGGSGLSQIPETLADYAATDADNALSVSRSRLLESEDTLREWAGNL